MKILGIRGANLASLDKFDLRLDRAPLSSAGLFAITGPTGAGKSTLLDALCLALYDTTPRVEIRGRGVLFGRADEPEESRVSSTDPRTLLRRGTGMAMAEVEFLGRGGKRYLAHWEVRRAREKADGRFQNQEMWLHDLDLDRRVAGGKRTEVKAAIVEKLGLDFDQFRRSALLAQGEFAAFLKANEDERSQLLAAMTGTWIYEQLGRGAFESARELRRLLDGLEQQERALALLSEERRGTAQQEIGALEAALLALAARLEGATGAVAWFEKADQQRAAVQRAVEQRATAERAVAAAAPRRLTLSEVEGAEALRAVVEGADRAQFGALERRRAAGVQEAEAQRASAAELVALQGRTLAAVARDEARRRRQELEPELAAAALLDAQLRGLEEREQLGVQRGRAAQAAVEVARERAAGLAQAVSQHETLALEAERWFKQNAQLQALVDGWSRWEKDLSRTDDLIRQLRSNEAAAGAIRARAEVAGEALRAAQGRRAEAARGLESAEGACHLAAEAARERPAAPQRAERDRLQEDRARLERAADLLNTVDRLERDLKQSRAAAAAAKAQGEAHAAAAELSRAEAERLKGRAEEAEIAVQTLTLALSLADHRRSLRGGEPCPLCGAAEHPWAEGAGPADEALLSQRERLKGLQRAGREALSTATAEAAHALACAAAASREEQRGTELDQQRLAEGLRLGPLLAGLAVATVATTPIDLHDPSVLRRLIEAQLRSAREGVSLLEQGIRAAEALERQAEGSRAAFEAARRRRDLEAVSVEAAAQEARQAEEAARGSAADRGRLEGEVELLIEGLGPAFELRQVDWRRALRADPQGARAAAHRDQRLWTSWRQKQESSAKELGQLRPLAATARSEAEGAQAARLQAEDDARRVSEEREAASRGRAGMLDGQPTVVVRGALDAAIAQAEAAAAAAVTAAEAALRSANEARGRVEAALEAALRAEGEASAAELARDAALGAEGVALATARARLAPDSAWRQRERAELARLDEALAAARSAEAVHVEQQAAHQAAPPPLGDALAAQTEVEASRAALAAAAERRAELRAELQRDDRGRDAAQALREALTLRRAEARPWLEMDSLIGSSDGKKFRVFAQSLTLDALLAEANHHLDELAPRYRLMRVPRYDLDLQVIDRDMGDEVRATTSLSGGESFLVSLALALALASLSAENTRVETLFIDEGFGTLDPATLEVALHTLDQLQSTGRQVGLISHVPGLAERIGAQVRVEPRGGGRSVVRVVG